MSYGKSEGKDKLVFIESQDEIQESNGSLDMNAASESIPEENKDSQAPQSAYNEETGEINWDCPCLGSMASGPCGDKFKDAFSCFVYSKEEPKGSDCVDFFRAMQSCFQEHPDIYGQDLDDESNQEDNIK